MMAILEYLSAHLIAISLEMTVLIALIAISDRLMKRIPSAFRYLLWVVVLIRLAVPVSIPVPDVVTEWIRGLTVVSVPVERIQIQTPVTVREKQVMVTSMPLSVQSFPQPVEEAKPLPPISVHAMIGSVWAVIAGMLIVIVMVRWLVMWYVLNKTGDLKDDIISSLVIRLSYMMGLARPVETRVWDAQSKEAVALAGVFRPRILLPRSMAESWLPDELEPIITHELAHAKRADLVVNWLQVVIQAVYFFHPLVWYMNHRIRHLREEACDDLAISVLGGSRKRYIESMLRVLDETTSAPAFGFAAIGFSERRSNIGERIRRIMTMKGTFSTRLTARAVCGLTGVLAVAFAISCGAGSVVRTGNGSEVHVVRPPVTEMLVVSEGDDPEVRQATVRNMLSSTEHDQQITLAAIRTSDSDSLLVDAIRNVAAAVSRETDLDVSVREMIPGDPALLDCSVAFMLGTDDIRQLNPEEAANLGAFMRGGGFLYADTIDPTQPYSQQEAGLRQLFKDTLTSYYRPLPIPHIHQMYHCYYDIVLTPVNLDVNLVVNGTPAPPSAQSMYYQEGFTVDGKLGGIYSDIDYINHWAADDTSEAIELGVNIVIYNVLRERGILIRDTPPGENDNARIQGTGMPRVQGTNNITVDIQGNGTYMINGEVVAKDELEQVLQATKVPNTEPLTNTLIVSGPGETIQLVRSEEYTYLDSVASSLGINGRKIIFEDESPGMTPTMPPALGIPDMEPAPIMLEMLDDGTYLVNGEIVTKDDLGRFSDAFLVKSAGENAPHVQSTDYSRLNTVVSSQELYGLTENHINRGYEMLLAQNITGAASGASISRSNDPLDPSTNYITVVFTSYEDYEVNGENVSKNELEKTLNKYTASDKKNALIVKGPEEILPPNQTLTYYRLDEIASNLGIDGRVIKYIDDEVAMASPNWPEGSKYNPITVDILDEENYRVNGTTVARDDIISAINQILHVNVQHLYVQGMKGDAEFTLEVLAELLSIENDELLDVLDTAERSGFRSFSIVKGDKLSPLLTRQASDIFVEPTKVSNASISTPYSNTREKYKYVTTEFSEILGGYVNVVHYETIKLSIIDATTYLFDNVKINRDDLERLFRENEGKRVEIEWHDEDTFESYAYINNIIQKINGVPEEGIPHIKAPRIAEKFVIDVIDEHTIRIGSFEMAPSELIGFFRSDNALAYTRDFVIRAGAELPVSVIYEIDRIIGANNKVYEVL